MSFFCFNSLKISILAQLFLLFNEFFGLMVGRLGTVELAAVAFGHSIFIVFMVFGMGLSYGMTPLIAEADGKKNTTEIGALLRDGFWMCFLSGLLLMLVMTGK